MKGSLSQPKVFISYSWTTSQHERWVLDLAERLSLDGVVVVLDKWDLKEGHDKHVFMEQMVQTQSIEKVLVICDHGYQTKADGRQGGVGTESQLISKEIYENTGQEKFIPIVSEFLNGKPCIPHFMGSRIYVDLSNPDTFEENYQKLIRNLYGKPLLKRPSIGLPPAYITEEDPIVLKTSGKIRAIRDALLHDRRSTGGMIADFLDTFVSSLEDFRLSGGSAPEFDEKVLKSIENMRALRDDFIDFVSMLFTYHDAVDLDQFHSFWERLIAFAFRPETVQSYTEIDFDNFKFFNYELMLSFLSVLFKSGKYREAGYFLHGQYFYRSSGVLTHSGVGILNQFVGSLNDVRNKRLNLQRTDLTADLIKARATHDGITFDRILESDLIVYYITELQGEEFGWFPRTSVYVNRGGGVELFDRMVSKRHFEKTKFLFNVQTLDELKTLVAKCVERKNAQQRYYSGGLWNYGISRIERVIDLQNLGTVQ